MGSAMRPILSPDGKKLVYATRFEMGTGLRVRDLETSEDRWLIYPVTRDDQESRATRDTMPGYTFMPDGKSLLVPINGSAGIWGPSSIACAAWSGRSAGGSRSSLRGITCCRGWRRARRSSV